MFIAGLAKRFGIFRHIYNNIQNQLLRESGLLLDFKAYRFEKMNTLLITDFSVNHERSGLYFKAEHLFITFKVMLFCKSRFSIQAIDISNSYISFGHGKKNVDRGSTFNDGKSRRPDKRDLVRIINSIALFPITFSQFSFNVRDIVKGSISQCSVVPTNKDALLRFEISTRLFSIDCNYISDTAIMVDRFSIDLNIALTQNSIHINDTIILFNDTTFLLQFFYDFESRKLITNIKIPKASLSCVLGSFPFFALNKKFNAKVDGKITFDIQFAWDREASKYSFNSDTGLTNLKFLEGNEFDLNYLNEFGQGSDYLSMKSIPELLKLVVIQTEDPRFYYHRGIDERLFGFAIVTNINNRAFKRGGSTLTMQTARNLMLGHDKNLCRKIEEIIIAYSMENVFGIPKDKIFEIYLNIIEWGPGIYGIKKAAFFYFNKEPSELSLTECLVLSYIIPRPKHFWAALLEGSPQVILNLSNHVRATSRALVKKQVIRVEQLKEIPYAVRFAEPIGIVELCD